VFRGSDGLNRGGDRRLIVERRPLGVPGAIPPQMLLHLGAPSWSVWPLRGTGAAVMGIAARPCHRGGAGTGRRPPAPGHPRVGLQPSPHGLGLLDGIVVGPHREPGLPCSRSAFLAGAEPGSAPPMGGPCPQAVVPRPGGRRAGAGQVMLRVLARRHARHRRPFGHPGTAHWGPQMASQVVRKHHRLLVRARRPHNPEAGQAGDPLGIIALSDRLGTLPPPAPFMAPAAPRLGRDRDLPLGLQRSGQRGTAPARAAPARGPGRRREQGQQRPPQGGDQHGGAPGRGPSPVVVGLPGPRPVPRGAYRPVHARARRIGPWQPPGGCARRHTAARYGGPAGSRRVRAAARPASGLVPPRAWRRRCAWAARRLRATRGCGPGRWLREHPRCANVLWTDLACDLELSRARSEAGQGS
jgi:hypothetical protein